MRYPIKTLQQLRPLLISYRKQAGLTQQALAERLGVTQQSYAQIEANPASTSVERLYLILRLLGVEMELASADAIPAYRGAMEGKRPEKIVPPSGEKDVW
ncbi:Antitoxin HipB [Janthinobacterium lividum]|uniref:Helix-turn-helix transcriptional regulator n=1 Tax=Janthinobacterium lividum TaxID=29581 RepID=A0A377RTH9_9BURK|nr:helix-turn-helix transcriptional regulator [Janthinobacterium lividum]TNC76178.1 helix-turn-helix transcriptional regulator [Janthinobacterium lividum]STR26128.1 Antitoxin HipB [Janthinobacterium lividum]